MPKGPGQCELPGQGMSTLDTATGPRSQDPSPHLVLFFSNNSRAPPLHPPGLQIVSTLLQMASQLKPSFFFLPQQRNLDHAVPKPEPITTASE